MAFPDNLPQSANIVGWWRFEDNFNDSSGNGYNLTETSGTIPFVSGKIGKAGDFEYGDSEYLEIAHASCINLQITGNITIAAWVKAESIPDVLQAIVGKYDRNSLRAYQLQVSDISGNKKARFVVSNDGSTVTGISGSTTLNTGTWYHVCGVYDGSYLRLYLNGSSDADAVSYSSGILNANTPFHIGCQFNLGAAEATRHWDGLIDEVIIWNKALSAGEVDQVYDITSYTYNKSLSGSLSATGSLVKQTQKDINGILSATGLITKSISKNTLGTLSFSGAISKTKNYIILLAGILSFTGSIIKDINKNPNGSLTFTSVLLKDVFKNIDGNLTFTGLVLKLTTVSIAGLIDFSGLLIKTANKVLSGAISLNASLSRNINKTLSGILDINGSVSKNIYKNINGDLTFAGAVYKGFLIALSGALNFTGRVLKQTNKNLSGSFTLRGILQRLGWNRLLKIANSWVNLADSSVSWTEQEKDSETWSETEKPTTEWSEE